MAFQNPGKPRFFCDLFQYLDAMGEIIETEALSEYYPGGSYTGPQEDTSSTHPSYFNHPSIPFGLDPYKKRNSPFYQDGAMDIRWMYQYDYLPKDSSDNYDDTIIKRLIVNDQMKNYINYFAVLGHEFQSENHGGLGGYLMPEIRTGIREADGTYGTKYLQWASSGYENVIGTELDEATYGGLDPHELHVKFTRNKGFCIWLAKDGLETGEILNPGGASGSELSGRWGSKFAMKYSVEGKSDAREQIVLRPSNYPVCSVSAGSTYTMSQSPNLEVDFTREFDGVDTIKTRGGSTLTNIRYSGPPKWGTGWPGWTLNFPTMRKTNISRVGRRRWSLSFDMLADDDVMGAYESVTNAPYGVKGYDENSEMPVPEDGGVDIVDPNSQFHHGNYFVGMDKPLMEEDSFYKMLVFTIGGKLPFIFQPDHTNNNADQFAICTIPQKSFSFTQKAHKLYSVSFEVVETW